MKTLQLKCIGVKVGRKSMTKTLLRHSLHASAVRRSSCADIRLACLHMPSSGRTPFLRFDRRLRQEGLLGRHIGRGGGHVSDAPLQRVRMVPLCSLRGPGRTRHLCRRSGTEVARKGDTRRTIANPYIAWPNMQASRANVCVRRPIASARLHPVFGKRAGSDISDAAGSARRKNVF